jgi:MYXO-CTERM domain-containing protein
MGTAHAECVSPSRHGLGLSEPGPTHQTKEISMLSTRSTCAVALAAALSMPCFAQSTTPSGSGTAATTGTTSGTTTSSMNRDEDRGDHGKWGWLGLLGLVGLMGLRRQPDTHRVDTTRTSAQR